jgi:hypothetical protein
MALINLYAAVFVENGGAMKTSPKIDLAKITQGRASDCVNSLAQNKRPSIIS